MKKVKVQVTKTKHDSVKKVKVVPVDKVKVVPINWQIPESIESKYANNMMISFDQESNVFILAFFETKPPIIVEKDEIEKKDLIKNIRSVDAICVARIVVPAKRINLFLKAFEKNVNNFIGKSDDE